jgi:hypothetical protein
MVVVVTTLSFSASAVTNPKSRQTSTELTILLPRILVVKRIIDLKIPMNTKLASRIIGASKKVRQA